VSDLGGIHVTIEQVLLQQRSEQFEEREKEKEARDERKKLKLSEYALLSSDRDEEPSR